MSSHDVTAPSSHSHSHSDRKIVKPTSQSVSTAPLMWARLVCLPFKWNVFVLYLFPHVICFFCPKHVLRRTPGPITGGAEVTGSRTMLPPALKRRQPAAGAPASRSSASSAHAAVETGAAAASAPAAVYMELRKPLVLSWDVELAPNMPTGPEGGQAAGGEMEAVTVAVGAGAVSAGSKVKVGTGAESEVSAGAGGGKGGRKMEDPSANRGNGVLGAAGEEGRGATGGDLREEEELGAGLEGTAGGLECARPRDPAWARLVFADRKR